jgi:acyl carrier protein
MHGGMQMNTSEIINEYIVNELLDGSNHPPISYSDDLIESGIIDSLGIMSLLGFLEERFSMRISSEDLLPENFSSINSITVLVDRQRRV